ncbi:hypothetical protein KGF56_004050 [Candida oxycetoniae]|uniref:J domain-containing protein n=1 Tax=Candida oxycetoniae TaxID=497107 RepID=A0AAI9SUJ4_9ASCO|nr:uncharacterized protein KGF56_004050 [Candida oxycetoniae]KAI3403161.2 hypothetical protein KGF56_004050 [Candida oxycetoniae]
MKELLPQIINDDIDLYSVLVIPKDATSSEIRRAYRKQALVHHPDKSTDSSRFNLILTSFQILSNNALRKQYDTLQELRNQKLASRAQVSDFIKKFQNDLLDKEKEAGEGARKNYTTDIDQLREDGIKRRRVYEQTIRWKNKTGVTKTIHDIPLPNMLSSFKTSTEGKLSYKNKPNLEITEMVLSEIMSIFGAIKRVELKGNDSRYAYAIIEYQDAFGLQNALAYDYSSARKWDGTKVRKLASLLRSFEKCNTNFNGNWTDNQKVNKILDQYVRSVSDQVT